MDLNPYFDYFLISTFLGCVCFFCSIGFGCAVKSLVLVLSNYFINSLSALNFPFSSAFIVPHKFGYMVH